MSSRVVSLSVLQPSARKWFSLQPESGSVTRTVSYGLLVMAAICAEVVLAAARKRLSNPHR